MRVSIVAAGKAKSLARAIRDYRTRAGRYWALEVMEVRQARGTVAAQVLRTEAVSIRARLRPGFARVAVTRGGDHLSSPELARWLERLAEGPTHGVHFLIGGAFGLDEELRDACGLSPVAVGPDSSSRPRAAAAPRAVVPGRDDSGEPTLPQGTTVKRR